MNDFDMLYNKYVYDKENELLQIRKGEKRRELLSILIALMWFGSTIAVGAISNDTVDFFAYFICSALVLAICIHPLYNKNHSDGSFYYIMSKDILPSIIREIFKAEELQSFRFDISIPTMSQNKGIKSEIYFNINNEAVHVFSEFFRAGFKPISEGGSAYAAGDGGTVRYRTNINIELKRPFDFNMKLKPPFKNKHEINASNEDLARGFLISKISLFETKHPKEHFEITFDRGRVSIVFYYHRLFNNIIGKFSKENLKDDFEFIYDLVYLLVLPITEIKKY